MTRSPDPVWGQEDRRNARIRQLREERDRPIRRRRPFQPVVLLGWFAGVIALVGVLIFIGFLAFAPRLMQWVQENPGSIEHGIVRDFVEWYDPGALTDEPVGGEQRVTVSVALGSSDADIGQMLFDHGLVRSPLAFQYAVLQAGREGTLEAGTYDLSPAMRPSEIVAALRNEAGDEVELTFQEGWRLEEVVGYVGSTPLTLNLEEFAQLVRRPPADLVNQYAFLADLPVDRTLEGYLYPDTYRVFANIDAREMVEVLLGNFEERFTPQIADAIAAQGLSVDEAVTLASIVEREAVLDEERPLIAGVYLNRINNPTGETAGLLNADPTLQYALATRQHRGAPVDEWGAIEWWPELQTAGRDVQVPRRLEAYQTYVTPGLPPTPIASPRMGSLEAVAFADTESGYLYFVAGCPDGQRDGSHYFARTYAEHQQNIARANQECADA
ncbi:MAG TPA: endolytic transglycosylase MltG [Candidatus Limnocylindria bacterium]|nr:endolytic transglycosylase MltG [Candidatus Limnocylindria bacterium]